MSTSHTSRKTIEVEEPVTVEQPKPKNLNVTINNFPAQDHFQNLPHYSSLPDGARTLVWTPSAGQKIHLVSLVVSTPAAGYITLYDRTPPATDTAFMRLDFNARQSVPFGLNTDLDFDWNHQLVAEWTQDAPGGGTAYITAIGHEHASSEWPP